MNQSNADARTWRPRVADGPAPYYQRIADALQEDIRRGALDIGARLPTQRKLADALDISVGTATSAYIEAERRGLVRRHVGRGTFVASPGTRTAASGGRINLAVNQPPFHAAAALIRGLFAQLIEDADTADLLGYPLFNDNGRYLRAVADWLGRSGRFAALDAAAILPCQGATQGLLATLELLLRPDDVLLCEAITYAGFKVAARQLGVRLEPVALDAEGMLPDALDEAAQRSGARVVVLCPSLQNPTGAVASKPRRQALVRVAQKRRLWIVEDDVYGGLLEQPATTPPLASLAPDITFHVGSASKIIAPGLRAGWIVTPRAQRDALAQVLQRRTAAAAPFGCPMMTAGATPFGFLAFAKLCETRRADEIATLIRSEAERRLDCARRVLGPHMQAPGGRRSLHVWLPLDAMRAEALQQALSLQEIHLTPPGAPMVAAPPSGLRLCLGGPENLQALDEALHVIAGELARGDAGIERWHP